MNMPLCSRCKKNVAVIFVTRLENGKTTDEGLCLQCAKELGIKPVTDMMEKLGITDSDIENVAKELENGDPEELMQSLMQGMRFSAEEEETGEEEPEEDEENSSRVPVIPFFSMRAREEREDKGAE